MKLEWELLHNVERKSIYVRMYFVVILGVVGIAVGIVVVFLAELNSRGWRIYRGNAAEIFVDKCYFKIQFLKALINVW